jgi:hypothetical protein
VSRPRYRVLAFSGRLVLDKLFIGEDGRERALSSSLRSLGRRSGARPRSRSAAITCAALGDWCLVDVFEREFLSGAFAELEPTPVQWHSGSNAPSERAESERST